MITQQDIEELYTKAVQTAKAMGQDDRNLDGVMINESGNIVIKYSHYIRGDTDTWEVYFTLEDLNKPIEVLIAEHKQKADEELKERVEREEKEKRRQQKIREEEEYERYLKLKTKYEKN